MKSLIFIISLLIGITSVFSQNYEPFIENIINETELDSLISIVGVLSGEDSVKLGDSTVIIKHRVSSFGNDHAADYIKQILESYGLEPYDQIYSQEGRNVIAVQEGSIFPDRQFILCAHYDAVTDYAADDNGSGVAAVLEAARILSSYPFSFTIIYAFWDEEEMALIGSRYFASDAHTNSIDIQGVINLDMIAWDDDNDGICEIHSRDIANSYLLANLVYTVSETYGLSLNPVIYEHGITNSDHSSFWDKDWGAILLIEALYGEDFNPYYHTVNDRLDSLNLPYFYNMTQLSIGSLATLAYFEYPFDRVHPHHLNSDLLYYQPNRDTIFISTELNNPENKNVQVSAKIADKGLSSIDSSYLYDDGSNGDAQESDGIYSGWVAPRTKEDIYNISINTKDLDSDYKHILPGRDSRYITSIGPVTFDSYSILNPFGNLFTIKLTLNNEGINASASDISVQISTRDTINVQEVISPSQDGISIPAGQLAEIEESLGIIAYNRDAVIPINIKIFSGDYHFWTDSFSVDLTPFSSIAKDDLYPSAFSLTQNYPNPFNPSTTIEFTLPKSDFVEMKVFNILGKEVTTLVSNKLNQGNHTYQFDGRNLASGVYYYQLVAGDYREVKKMILLR